MFTKSRLFIVSLLIFVLSGCSSQTRTQTIACPAGEAAAQAVSSTEYQTMLDASNPFATESPLPYGLVDFTKIRPEHYLPAFKAGMAQQLEEIDRITQQTDDPTFENTLIPLEKSGRLLSRTAAYFSNDAGANTNDEIKAIQTEIAPLLAAHNDAIYLNEKLFNRIKTLYDKRETFNLDAESLRLLDEYHKDFVRSGAALSAEDKAVMRSINAELAELTTQFGQNILTETNNAAVIVENVEELDGMSSEEIQQAAELAKDRGLDGKYLIAIKNTSIQPVLKSLKNRSLRERIHQASISRCMHGNETDNTQNTFKILELRTKRANLLGFQTYADYAISDRMARKTKAVNLMLGQLVQPAKKSLDRERAELQALVDAQNGGFQIAAHDWFFYAEQLRKQKYALDDNELKPYFELNHVIENGVFYAANQLYGITFVERKDLPVYNPDVRIFEVFDADGSPLALFIGDYYARPSKRGGAWKSQFSAQARLTGDKPIIINQINIAKPAAGEPTLLTLEEVTTLFHEFGHALHEMFSDVTYPKFAGTRVQRDFVEFPSQFNEIWALWPEILDHYAIHYRNGNRIPAELVAKITAAAQFNQGYMTTEHLAAALLDQFWHQIPLERFQALPHDDLAGVEASMLNEAELNLPMVPPRYRSAYFNHVFAGGYAAGYYAYMWSEVLDADAEDWFKSHGLSRENGEHLRKTVLSKGFSEDSMKLYQDFAGREPSITPLLVRRGLQ